MRILVRLMAAANYNAREISQLLRRVFSLSILIVSQYIRIHATVPHLIIVPVLSLWGNVSERWSAIRTVKSGINLMTTPRTPFGAWNYLGLARNQRGGSSRECLCFTRQRRPIVYTKRTALQLPNARKGPRKPLLLKLNQFECFEAPGSRIATSTPIAHRSSMRHASILTLYHRAT
jgi:hypothetical protein